MSELAKWATALPTLIGFGLALGLNPALYVATADTLARGENVWAKLSAMIFGLFLGATVLALILHSFNPNNLVKALKGKIDAALISKAVDSFVGILFILGAITVIIWKLKAPKLTQKTPNPPKENSQSLSFFVIGLSSSIIGFTTLPIMYLTARLVMSLSHDPLLRVLAYSIFLVALSSPFVIIAFLWSKFPETATKVSGKYAAALQWDYRWFVAIFLVITALIFFALALFLH